MLCGCVSDWTYKDTLRQAGITSLVLIDRNQTKRFLESGKMEESNRLLGDHPSLHKVDNYMACSLLGNFIVSSLLDSGDRSVWQTVSLGVNFSFVSGNYRRFKAYKNEIEIKPQTIHYYWYWNGYYWTIRTR